MSCYWDVKEGIFQFCTPDIRIYFIVLCIPIINNDFLETF